ncbi:MAG: hypothetical protein JWO09_2103 [Bacteroidetes bacterium]|nr:hypothetical protein [Bacteroidota bacterium]
MSTSAHPADTSRIDSSVNQITPSVEIAQGIILQDSIIEQMNNITPWTYKYSEGHLSINAKVKINDRSFYILYEIADGVSSTDYVMTFVDNHYKDYEVVDQHHDQELSFSRYEYKTLRNSSGRNFIVVDYIESAADKNKVDENDEWFKEGFNFENVKIETDSTVVSLTVMNNGTIKRDTL